MKKTFEEIEEKYELELDRIVKNIKEIKAKKVLLQFPDGIKPYATLIVDELEKLSEKEKLKIEFFIWLGSCYGACDIPVGLENITPKIDLVIQFGHVSWHNNSPIWEG